MFFFPESDWKMTFCEIHYLPDLIVMYLVRTRKKNKNNKFYRSCIMFPIDVTELNVMFVFFRTRKYKTRIINFTNNLLCTRPRCYVLFSIPTQKQEYTEHLLWRIQLDSLKKFPLISSPTTIYRKTFVCKYLLMSSSTFSFSILNLFLFFPLRGKKSIWIFLFFFPLRGKTKKQNKTRKRPSYLIQSYSGKKQNIAPLPRHLQKPTIFWLEKTDNNETPPFLNFFFGSPWNFGRYTCILQIVESGIFHFEPPPKVLCFGGGSYICNIFFIFEYF